MGLIRDLEGSNTKEALIVYGSDQANSKFFYLTPEGEYLENLGIIRIPGSRSNGADLISFLPPNDEGGRGNARAAILGAGFRVTPTPSQGVHLAHSRDLWRIGDQALWHDQIVSGRFPLTMAEEGQEGPTIADIAVSSPFDLMTIWHDPNRNEIRFVSMDFGGHTHEHTAFTFNSTASWLRLEAAGQGAYIGVITTTAGEVYAFNTTDNGLTWTLELLAQDLQLTTNSDNWWKADIAFDARDSRFIVVWTATSGIRLAHKEMTDLLDRYEGSFNRIRLEESTIRNAETLIGLDIEEAGDRIGTGAAGLRIAMAIGVIAFLVLISWGLIRRVDYGIAMGASTGILLTLAYGLLPPWVFFAIVFISSALTVIAWQINRRQAT